MAMKSQMMDGRARPIARAIVQNALADGLAGGRETNLSRRTEAIVEIFVPLRAESGCGQSRHPSRRQERDVRVAPEAQLSVGCWNLDGKRAALDHERGTGQRVFGTSSISGRTEAQVAPPCGLCRHWIAAMCFFVADHCAVRR